VRQLSIELDELNGKLLDMGALVESAIRRSASSLVERRRDLAQQVIADAPRIHRMEGEIDAMATRMLALRQPVARDLRLLTAALKINNDLERMGDLSAHVAERAVSLIDRPPTGTGDRIMSMACLVESMLLKCLDAFVSSDAELASSVLPLDDQVDALRDHLYTDLVAIMQRNPSMVPSAIDLIFVARNLERIGDHAANIAGDVVFLVKGVDIRQEARRAEML